MRAAMQSRLIPALAGLVILCSGPALAEACTTEEQAMEQYEELVADAVERMQAEALPDTLHKDKIGRVLVARAAASRETDQKALRRDIHALSEQLERSPRDICRAVERVRRTHAL